MTERPFYPRYAESFQTACRKHHMTLEEQGAYSCLLDWMWIRGAQLPHDHRALARILGVTPKKFATLWAKIGKFFYIHADGSLRQARMQAEWDKADRVSAARAEAVGKRKDRQPPDQPRESDVDELFRSRDPTSREGTCGDKPLKTQEPSATIEDNILHSTESPIGDSDSPDRSEKKPTQQNGDAVRRGTRLASDWRPDTALVAYGVERGFDEAATLAMAEDFRDFWAAKAGKDAMKLDWAATWRRWVREETKRKRRWRAPRTPGLQADGSFVRADGTVAHSWY